MLKLISFFSDSKWKNVLSLLVNVPIFFLFCWETGQWVKIYLMQKSTIGTAEDRIALTNIRHLCNSLQAHTKTAASILSQNWLLITYKDWISAGRRIDVVNWWKSSNEQLASSPSLPDIFLNSHLAASARTDARKIANVTRTGESAIYFWKTKERKWNEMRLKPKYISCPIESASQISSIYQGDKTDIQFIQTI